MPEQQSNDETGSASKQTRFQQFTTETVHRSVLKGAPYNPRYLKERGKAKLREALSRVGLVQPVVWNKRTGNIVGGHQRISQIDALEGSADYTVTVAVVDVPIEREKELNVLLNNTDVGGEWDLDKLKTVLTDADIDMLNTGFDNAEFMKFFGENPAKEKAADHQESLSKQMDAVKDAYDKLTKMSRTKDDQDFYNVIVFGSYNERREFLEEFGFEDNRYIDGRVLMTILSALKEAKATSGRPEGKKAGVGDEEPEAAVLEPA